MSQAASGSPTTAPGKYIDFVTRNVQGGAGVSTRRLAELRLYTDTVTLDPLFKASAWTQA